MEVRHRGTGKTQTMEKSEFDKLVDTGHAKNFEVLSDTDYVPDELSLPPKKGKAEAPPAKE